MTWKNSIIYQVDSFHVKTAQELLEYISYTEKMPVTWLSNKIHWEKVGQVKHLKTTYKFCATKNTLWNQKLYYDTLIK